MKYANYFIRVVFIVLASLALPAGNSFAAEGAIQSKTTKELLLAVQNDDYNAFIENKSAPFKKALTKDLFRGISGSLSSRLKSGYEMTFFGIIRRQGLDLYYWKLAFKDGGDDTLILVAFKNDEVTGFFYR